MAPSRNIWNQRDNNDGQDDDLLSQDGGDRIGPIIDDGDAQNDADVSASPSTSSNPSNDSITGLVRPVYTSQFATLFILVNVTVGTGLLAMPFAMQAAGIVTSMIIQIILLVFIVITCIMCIELTIKSNVKSYHEIIQKHCHAYLYQLTQVSIFIFVFAVAVAYIVVIGDQSDRIFASLYGPTFCQTWYMHRRFIMSLSTLLVMKPLCSAKTVDFLKYASFLGVVSIGFIFFVVADDFSKISHIPADVNYFSKSWSDVASILPILCLGYQCHLSLVPTVATIRRQDKSKAFITATVAMIISMIVYSAISILAVLTFGSTIEKDLTESFSGKARVTLVTIAIVALKCSLTLPAAYLPARLSLVDILINNWPRFANFSEPVQRISVTLVFLDVALLIAILVPDILTVVNLIGCVAVMFIFSLPGMAYISLVKQNRREKQQASGLGPNEPLIFTARDRMKLWTSYFMVVFGVIMTGVVLSKSIAEMMTNVKSLPLCHTSNSTSISNPG